MVLRRISDRERDDERKRKISEISELAEKLREHLGIRGIESTPQDLSVPEREVT